MVFFGSIIQVSTRKHRNKDEQEMCVVQAYTGIEILTMTQTISQIAENMITHIIFEKYLA